MKSMESNPTNKNFFDYGPNSSTNRNKVITGANYGSHWHMKPVQTQSQIYMKSVSTKNSGNNASVGCFPMKKYEKIYANMDICNTNSNNYFGYKTKEDDKKRVDSPFKKPKTNRQFLNEELKQKLNRMNLKSDSLIYQKPGQEENSLKGQYFDQKQRKRIKDYRQNLNQGKFDITPHYDINIFKMVNGVGGNKDRPKH